MSKPPAPGAPRGPAAPPTPPAQLLWEEDPIRTLERLRDRVCDAIDLVTEIHRRAYVACFPQAGAGPFGRDDSLTNIAQELHAPLLAAISDAQDIWFHTAARRFLDRPQPVPLERAGRRPVMHGSCYHDLSLALAVGLHLWIEEGCSARAFLAKMRYSTAAGDDVAQRLTNLKAEVASEAQQGIARWRAEAEARSRPLNSAGGKEVVLSPVNDGQHAASAVSRRQVLQALPPAARKAFLSFEYAEFRAGKRLKDPEAHTLLAEEGVPDDLDGLADYQLPALDTWTRQLRVARKAVGEQKNTPRRGRPQGRCIANPEQL